MVRTDDTTGIEPIPGSPGPVPPRRRRGVRALVVALLVLIVLCIVAVGGVAWYFSSQAMGPVPEHLSYSQRVLGLVKHRVTITQTGDTVRPGTYRLEWRGGQVILGNVLSDNGQAVTRRMVGAHRGPAVGTPVHFDSYIYNTPASLGLHYRTVRIPDPLGPMPAWLVPGKSSTWVIVVHGRGTSRIESLRPMSTLTGMGLPVLAISYRNDLGAPASSDHLYHFGATEWQDLEAAVRYARAHGATHVILYGFSMGGSIVESFMHRSRYSGMVRAAVLDSPALDWAAIFTFRAPGYLPSPLVDLSEKVVQWRLGISSLDQSNDLLPEVNYKVPTLFFQGTADTSVPPQRNIALARMRPKQVTLVLFPGAEHTQEWNNNPAHYTSALKGFLARILG